MMEKRYVLIKIEIIPATTIDGEDGPISVPRVVSYAYQTEIVEGGEIIARSPVHRGTAPADAPNQEVAISLDGTRKTVQQVLAEAGIE